MGVKLWDLIPKKEVSIDDLKNKTLVVDASPVLYQFLTSIRQPGGVPLLDSKNRITSHLMGIFSRVSNLLMNNVKLCFVFDGKPPLLKIKETEEREYKKQIAEKKFKEAQEQEDIILMTKYSKRFVRLSDEIINESKELLRAFGIPVIQAPSEAEAQCAFIAEQGDAYAIVSQDADSLLSGTPRLIRNLTISQKRRLPSGQVVNIKPEIIELKNVLSFLDINQDQLIVLAILIGTDYNREGVKKVGPKSALKLVKQYHDFNELFKEVKADFNWKEIYAVFKSMPIMKNYQLKFSSPDNKKIKEILVEEHDFDEKRVINTLNKLNKPREQGLNKWF